MSDLPESLRIRCDCAGCGRACVTPLAAYEYGGRDDGGDGPAPPWLAGLAWFGGLVEGRPYCRGCRRRCRAADRAAPREPWRGDGFFPGRVLLGGRWRPRSNEDDPPPAWDNAVRELEEAFLGTDVWGVA